MSNGRRTAAKKTQITQQEVEALAAAVEEIGERIEASATRIAERFHAELSGESISVCDLQSAMRSLKKRIDSPTISSIRFTNSFDGRQGNGNDNPG